AVGEVDQLEDPVHECVAESDERVDGAVRQPDERDGEEVRRTLLEVDGEPQDEQTEQKPGRGGCRVRARRALGSEGRVCADVGSHGMNESRYAPGEDEPPPAGLQVLLLRSLSRPGWPPECASSAGRGSSLPACRA